MFPAASGITRRQTSPDLTRPSGESAPALASPSGGGGSRRSSARRLTVSASPSLHSTNLRLYAVLPQRGEAGTASSPASAVTDEGDVLLSLDLAALPALASPSGGGGSRRSSARRLTVGASTGQLRAIPVPPPPGSPPVGEVLVPPPPGSPPVGEAFVSSPPGSPRVGEDLVPSPPGSPRVGESCREATERGRFPVAPTIGRRHDRLTLIVHPRRIRTRLPPCHPERAPQGESKDPSRSIRTSVRPLRQSPSLSKGRRLASPGMTTPVPCQPPADPHPASLSTSLRTSDRCHWCGNPFPARFFSIPTMPRRIRTRLPPCHPERAPRASRRILPAPSAHSSVPCANLRPFLYHKYYVNLFS